jgi:RNA polymerase sigma factor (sigma-70 family)
MARRKIGKMPAHKSAPGGRTASGQSNGDPDAAVVRDLMREAKLAGPLETGEQDRLLERASLGDRASHDRLVAAHLPVVVRLAGARAERGLSVSDLVQEGSIGLVEAVRSFAGSGEGDFFSFAESHIGAQMDAAIAAEAAAVRDAELLVAAATDYERAELVMRRTLHREPADTELAEKLEWTVDRTRYIAQVVAEARRRHDEELLAFIDPEAIDFDDEERADIDA